MEPEAKPQAFAKPPRKGLGRAALLASLIALSLMIVLFALFLSGHTGAKGGADKKPTDLAAATPSATPAPARTSPQVRCYINGALAGQTSFADCAAKGGTASQIDPTVAPLTTPVPEATPVSPHPATSEAAAETAECLRFSPEGWRGGGAAISLSACVRVLFAGKCVATGQAEYGRWGEKTLRLLPGKVEISNDNANFRTLIDQDAKDCAFPAL